MSHSELLRATAQTLLSPTEIAPALLGFDGFIDTICDVVSTRRDAGNYERVPTLANYAARIAASAGQSTNIEIVPTLVKLGGNGPIMANALTALNLSVTYCGMTGFPHANPVFEEFGTRARLLPVCEPALTDAYEFDDGKLIVGKHATVAQVSFENLIERIGRETLQNAWDEAGFVAMVNWTMLPFMTPLWKHIAEELDGETGSKTLFFDLADPEKRGRADIFEALQTLAAFAPKHKVILGLNEKEAVQIGQVLDLPTPLGEVLTPETAPALAAAIRARLEIAVVVVHPTRFAAAASENDAACVEGPWTAKPRISTGAGDHFNAGFCLGQLLGADLSQSLQIGVGTSGFYVRNAQSPSREDLSAFLKELASENTA